MHIQILHISDCPNWREAGERVHAALDHAGLVADGVTFEELRTSAEAEAVAFSGSPTILVDGTDLFPSDGATADLACRVYISGGRLVGLPSTDDIIAALEGRRS